jgi:hypothetical protein
MATVTVSVNATPRISRVEIISPYLSGTVNGHSEVLLEEPGDGSNPELAKLLSTRSVTNKTLGVMPGALIARGIDVVLEESVEVDGKTITFQNVMDAMEAFFTRWREEDANAMVPEPMMAPAAITPPPMPDRPAEMDVNPPPELSRPRE